VRCGYLAAARILRQIIGASAMLKRFLPAIIAAFALFGPASAQSVPPFAPASPTTVGTSSIQVLAYNPARRRVIFFNPNPTAILAFCPALTRGGAALTCAVNGTGSITLLPRATYVVDGGTPSGPALAMGSAWNAIADTASSAYTAYEFE
jgi:hypothetical protein